MLIFSRTANNGVGISGDSVGYITWARYFSENFTFSKPDGSGLVIWPPFYSTSNAIYLFANIEISMSPSNPDWNSSPERKKFVEKEINDFKSILESEKNVYLVWFTRHFRTYLYDPQQLQEFCNMKIIKKLQDGYIIALYPKNTSNAPTQ